MIDQLIAWAEIPLLMIGCAVVLSVLGQSAWRGNANPKPTYARPPAPPPPPPKSGTFVSASNHDIDRLIEAARADERQSILQLCKDMSKDDASGAVLGRTLRIIEAIEARSQS